MECLTFSSIIFSLKGLGRGWWLIWVCLMLRRLLRSWVAAVVRWGEFRTRRYCWVFLWLCDVDLRTSLCESWASRYLILDNWLLPEHGFDCGDISFWGHTTLRRLEVRTPVYRIVFNLHVRCFYLLLINLYFKYIVCRFILRRYW